MSGVRAAVALIVGVGAVSAAPLAAQDVPTLDRVDSLIAEQSIEAARATLTEWLAARETRSRADAQRAIWQRALLTVDPEQAAVDYQRLVLEYPGGPWSDRALLRLAQGADAQGDPERARALLAALLRDYPASPARLEASALMGSLASAGGGNAPAAANPAEAGQPVQSVRDPVPAARIVTLTTEPPAPAAAAPTKGAAAKPAAAPKRAEANARTAPRSAARPPEPKPEQPTLPEVKVQPPKAAPPDSASPRADRWTVQLGAFASPERADGLKQELAAAGIQARLVLVPGSRLIRVRTGRFDSQAAADRERERLAARGLPATVAGDADREEAAP